MRSRKISTVGLTIGALGVVFGDLGTSPLYVLPATFEAGNLPITPTVVYGIVSLIIWTLIAIVSVKYIHLIMHADNHGEGGIMALVSQLQKVRMKSRTKLYLVLLGLAGMALFYGDSLITPAISVLSAVEGIKIIQPELAGAVIPTTIAILLLLFSLQARGSGAIGKLFGPVMLIWFILVGIGGILQLSTAPTALVALLPTSAIIFIATYPLVSFIVLGAVVLAVTGAEALYADMGHFNRSIIKKAWFWVVFPALVLNYMGQGTLLLSSQHASQSPFFMLYPAAMQPAIVVLATLATLIASQAVISGAFSLTHQAIQLGYMPRMMVRFTSRRNEGQVYIPFINWFLCITTCLLVVVFGSSTKLAAAYGVAVSGALLIDTLLFIAVLARVKHASLLKTSLFATIFIAIEVLFVASTSMKIISGGWIPVFIAVITGILLYTWMRGHAIVAQERNKKEQTLHEFIRSLKSKSIVRLPGHAVYLGSHNGYAPLALEASVHQLHELHEKVVVATVEIVHKPHVSEKERIVFDDLKDAHDGISHVTIRFGFSDHPNIPKALEYARRYSKEIDFNPHTASYFVSQQKPVVEGKASMPSLQKYLFLFMARNATNASDYYKLPADSTIQMSTYVRI